MSFIIEFGEKRYYYESVYMGKPFILLSGVRDD